MRVLDSGDAARALARLALPGAILSRDARRGHFVLTPGGDRRRRPLARLSPALVRSLAGEGALAEIEPGERYRLSPAGRARVLRAAAAENESYRAQHEAVLPRVVMDADGEERAARGVDPSGPLARLERLTDDRGKPFFAPDEMAAAHRLRADFEAGQRGLVRGSDWRAPPPGGAGRGPGGVEGARAAGLDARRRLEAALQALAPALAGAARAACLHDQALGDIERAQRWPSRSGKLALKLALAQLAAHYRGW